MTPFEKLLSLCLDLNREWSDEDEPGGYKLGHHNDLTGEIVLYGVENSPENLDALRGKLASTGAPHRVVIHDPKGEYTNVGIIDIGL